MLLVKRVNHFSKEYRQAVYLRYKILREPLGLHFSREQLEDESNQVHIVAEYNSLIVGYLCLVPREERRFRMRQVAIAENQQGKGIGRQLVLFSEKYAIEHDAEEIYMHARLTAIEFYRKLGYKKRGEIFTEVGLPHFEMYKKIVPESLLS